MVDDRTELVTYSKAVYLRKLGFREPVHWHYNERAANGVGPYYTTKPGNYNHALAIGYDCQQWVETVSAPTVELARKWMIWFEMLPDNHILAACELWRQRDDTTKYLRAVEMRIEKVEALKDQSPYVDYPFKEEYIDRYIEEVARRNMNPDKLF